MNLPDALHTLPYWQLLTRLGEAEILLPVAALTAIALFFQQGKRRLAVAWMGLIATAILVTAASKIAFIGWGLGVASINFTGVSGHAMFAAAIYPMLMVTFLAGDTRAGLRRALLLGCALALLVGVSRIAVGAHSWSEVVAGLLVGAAVTAAVLAVSRAGSLRMPVFVPLALLAWMAITPAQMQASQSHSLVTRVALNLSGHVVPYTRNDLLRSARQQAS